ncbi:hypothetical protein P3X46_023703 [Hevea brasiliensis]|uniref:Uncharacterized protein n=2 Tax=Hevea brasiliensis TaxID=3981 RepID=A0ABQ9LBW5_HEVBR|nr:hypothetical protein P3X46_023703 [Hevea brasiliensis]
MELPFLRPPDYHAEMVKSDAHMEKVTGRLLAEGKNIQESEKRRKAREAKRLSKEVQTQKLKERAMKKKMEIETVKKWRKQRQESGFSVGDKDGEMNLPFDDAKVFERPNKKRRRVSPGDRSGGKVKQYWKKGSKNGLEKKLVKREARNSKFGFCGRKGLKKQNTADTADNFRGFDKGGAPGNKKRNR